MEFIPGTLSCFHGEQRPYPPADQSALFEHTSDATRMIMRYCEEASSRLPLDEMPDLAGWIYAAGHCYGVADPVTNVMLNAIAMLLSEEHTPPPPSEAGDSYQMATRSYTGLCAFMAAYFRHLSSMQAQRYLHLARWNLPVAVMLVHFDLSVDTYMCRDFVARHPLLPDGGQAKAALRSAALQAEHPAPHILAGAMTARYPASHPVISKLSRLNTKPHRLSTQDVQEIKELLSHQWPRSDTQPATLRFWCRPDGVRCTWRGKDELLIPVCLGDGVVARVLIQTGGDYLHDEPLKHITDDDTYKYSLCCRILEITGMVKKQSNYGFAKVNYDDRPCEYIRFLKMSILETIHSRYIEALSILPTRAWTPRFIRALLVAGHCYGPMDLVMNIIVSTIWYDVVYGVDVELPKEILGTKPLSRIVSRSLDGLVAIWRPNFKSEHDTLCSIHYHGCSSGGFHAVQSESGSSMRALLVAAAMAAKHPQHAEFAAFLAALNVPRLDSLLSRRDVRISDDSWDLLTSFIREEAAQHAVAMPAHAPMMNSFDLRISYGDKLNFLCAKLKKLLRDYCYKHPWEPSYQLDIICGVMEKTASYHKPALYHANFLARLEDVAENHDSVPSDQPRTLFFAEFWGPSIFGDAGSKLSSCSTVHPSSVGRCSLCECEASMIIHPPSGGHSGDIDGSVDVYDHALQKLEYGFEGSLGTEIIYCDHNRYVGKELPVNAPMDFPWDVPKDLPRTSSKLSFERQKPVQRLTTREYLRTLGTSSETPVPLGSRTFLGMDNPWG